MNSGRVRIAPNDPARILKQLILDLQKENAQLRADFERMRLEIRQLKRDRSRLRVALREAQPERREP